MGEEEEVEAEARLLPLEVKEAVAQFNRYSGDVPKPYSLSYLEF